MLQDYKKITINEILKKKNIEPITMITAYDALFAKLFDDYVDMILVGDSLNMSFCGQDDTLSADINQMLYHTKAVLAGSKRAFVVADMAFGSYQTPKKALKNATKLIKIGADAVKLEGGLKAVESIQKMTQEGINVVGHIGLMPQFVRSEGGYKIKGKSEDDAKRLISEAKAIQDAGAFCIVVECTAADVAQSIAKSVEIPVIGIGSGANVDGQVLVFSDMLGFFEGFKPKFVKGYLDGSNLVRNAVKNYVSEVKQRTFPSKEFQYEIKNG
ncbi:MAG: 3-methyl-2-oxobutanoate hydroxymethyltransferase [Campylobacter sp.]